MIRQHLAQSPGWGDPQFRWRGGDVSRVEGLSDTAFGVAMALLVVSTDVPESYAQLQETLADAPAFLICFIFLIMPWYAHYKFFRRFGLQDLWTIMLNTLLLFGVLLYVYPLKFLATFLFDLWLGRLSRADIEAKMAGSDGLMIIYGAGVVGIFGLLFLLNLHGYRRRRDFELNEVETFLTRSEMSSHLIMVAVASTSIIMSLAGMSMTWCGMVYFRLGPLYFAHGWHRGATVERLAAGSG